MAIRTAEFGGSWTQFPEFASSSLRSVAWSEDGIIAADMAPDTRSTGLGRESTRPVTTGHRSQIAVPTRRRP